MEAWDTVHQRLAVVLCIADRPSAVVVPALCSVGACHHRHEAYLPVGLESEHD